MRQRNDGSPAGNGPARVKIRRSQTRAKPSRELGASRRNTWMTEYTGEGSARRIRLFVVVVADSAIVTSYKEPVG